MKKLNTEMRIVAIRTRNAGGYHNQFHRSYAFIDNTKTLQSLADRVADSKGLMDDAYSKAASLSGIRRELLECTVSQGNQIAIPGGWAANRLWFELDVEMVSPSGITSIQRYQGYTDKYDVDEAGRISDDTVLYLNSSVRLHKDSGVIRSNLYLRSHRAEHFDDVRTVRPDDVFRGIHSNMLMQAYLGADMIDTRMVMTRPAVTDPINDNGSVYLATMLNAYQTAKVLIDFGGSSNDVMGSASGHCYGGSINDDPFLCEIAWMGQFHHMDLAFTMEQLRALDSSNDGGVVNAHAHMDDSLGARRAATRFISWVEDNSLEAQVAVQVSRELQSYMTRLGIGSVKYDFVNKKYLFDYDLLTGGRVSPERLAALENLVLKTIATELPCDVAEFKRLEVHANSNYETFVDLQYSGGNEPERLFQFVLPSFASGLTSPQLVSTPEEQSEAATSFERLLGVVFSDEKCT